MLENQSLQSIDMENRIRKMEIKQRLTLIGWIVSIVLIAMPAWIWQSSAQKSDTIKSLKVSELIVTDPKGVIRARIGGDLPDAVINGKQIVRGEKAAGIILYDGTGQERSGYVTFEPSGNVGLTLDTQKEQVGYFVAGRDGGAVMRLWHNNDQMEIRSDSEGSRLTAVKDGKIVSQQPEVKTMAVEACDAYKDARKTLSEYNIMSECQKRYKETACNACLNKR